MFSVGDRTSLQELGKGLSNESEYASISVEHAYAIKNKLRPTGTLHTFDLRV